MEARGGIEPPIEVLQTSALPLGDRALGGQRCGTPSLAKLGAGARAVLMERETGFEPATSTLARSHSTTELLPLAVFDYSQCVKGRANERSGYLASKTLRKYSYLTCTFVILTSRRAALPWRWERPGEPLGYVSSLVPGRGESLFDNFSSRTRHILEWNGAIEVQSHKCLRLKIMR